MPGGGCSGLERGILPLLVVFLAAVEVEVDLLREQDCRNLVLEFWLLVLEVENPLVEVQKSNLKEAQIGLESLVLV